MLRCNVGLVQIRNPKPEGRKPKGIRRPRAEGGMRRHSSGAEPHHWITVFGFRVSRSAARAGRNLFVTN